MFGVNLNPANLVSQIALGAATGGTSLLAQAALQIASQVVQQVVQQVGQQLHLPQSAIDIAKSAAAGSMGDISGATQNLSQGINESIESIGEQLGASPADIGSAQSDVTRAINDMVTDLATKGKGKHGGEGGSWLQAIAEALGEKLDKMAGDLEGMAKQLSDDKPSLTAKFGAKSQQFAMLMNATNDAIKTLGEGMKTMASRQ